ncbi:MAG TPA: Xaa-Pro peptidase family protein [Candidatus Mcinerneyibacteriales bacterium]|nr:Xaa-Pro peptidase family protein [Candidatus Mcinerneyibacteriales bacterium]HPQ88949.1 Xaa-Pro peptidase family protein [Candidatus Mcinerneyibacteriales bacterium]
MDKKRLQRVMDQMNQRGVNQMLLTSSSNIFYMTRLSFDPGERFAGLLIKRGEEPLFFCNRLFPQGDESPYETVWHEDGEDPLSLLVRHLSPSAGLAVDKDCPARFLFPLLELSLPLSDASSVIDRVRMVKDEEEIKLMKEASLLNDKALAFLAEAFHPEVTEKELVRKLDDFYTRNSSSFSFAPLIAFGSHAAVPHHESGTGTPLAGSSVLFDIGGRTKGYCSDMTRTFSFGPPAPKLKEIYAAVLEANQAAESVVKPGISFSEIDRAAREIITQKGYGDFFTHRTGHNIGIDVHEFPDVSSVNSMAVEAGMVFSIEPGIYLPGEYGVRIEDLVLVTKNGAEVLNHFPKELSIL